MEAKCWSKGGRKRRQDQGFGQGGEGVRRIGDSAIICSPF